jgi:CRP/FNR family cyclic AMP-dependent transcriptional regulator
MKRIGKGSLDLLQNDEWFKSISPALREVLMRDGAIRKFDAGAVVYDGGDEPSGLFAVLTGEVRLLCQSDSGKYAFYFIHRPISWFGALSELDGLTRFSSAIAWSETSLLHVRHSALQRLLADEPSVYRDFTMMMCSALRTTLDLIANAKAVAPRAHTAQLLVMMSTTQGAGTDGAMLLTQEQLAAMVGVSRQLMNKILQEFERSRLIRRQYGKIVAVDRAALAGVARHKANAVPSRELSQP